MKNGERRSDGNSKHCQSTYGYVETLTVEVLHVFTEDAFENAFNKSTDHESIIIFYVVQ